MPATVGSGRDPRGLVLSRTAAARVQLDLFYNGLAITHLETALLLESEKQDALPFINAAAVHSMNNIKKISSRISQLSCLLLLCSRASGKVENRPKEGLYSKQVDT